MTRETLFPGSRSVRTGTWGTMLLLGGCGLARPGGGDPPALSPPLPVVQPAQPRTVVEPRDLLDSLPPGPPVTLSARDQDVRALLVGLAELAGISLVLDPAVEGRITVRLDRVPARDALRTVLAAAGLSLVTGPPAAPWGPVVFYTVPINIDTASPAQIRARWNVGPEALDWIIRSRPR